MTLWWCIFGLHKTESGNTIWLTHIHEGKVFLLVLLLKFREEVGIVLKELFWLPLNLPLSYLVVLDLHKMRHEFLNHWLLSCPLNIQLLHCVALSRRLRRLFSSLSLKLPGATSWLSNGQIQKLFGLSGDWLCEPKLCYKFDMNK